jgi:AraC-like DNA-binding protein
MDGFGPIGHSRDMTADTLDMALRLIAIGEMLIVALVVARSRASVAIRRGTGLLLACVIGYLVQSVAGPVALASASGLVVQVASTGTALALWLFTHALFDVRADRRVAMAAGAVLLATLVVPMAIGWCRVIEPWSDRLGHLVMAALVLHALAVAVGSRTDDLSEKRRGFALAFVGLVAIEALVILWGEAWFGLAGEPAALRLTEAALILGAGLVTGGALLEADPDLIGGAPGEPDPTVPDPAQTLAPAEQVLRDRLDRAMAEGAWRQPGLTIGDLAGQLGVPEHRLRALINRRLGHRNFSAFLNLHRIAEARARLADPVHVALPVLTIAMDLGYGSLAPFNRAFREATGQTPTDFRRSAFAEPGKI